MHSKSAALLGILRDERVARNLEPESLSASLGLHPHVIARWEEGTQRPRLSSAVRWAEALGFEIQITRRAL